MNCVDCQIGCQMQRLTYNMLAKSLYCPQSQGGTTLSEANLKGADPEAAEYLNGTKMRAVRGLTQVQREACIKKGAIFDSTDQPAIPDADKSSSRSDASS
jgi:hypothetical protein